jgi:SAM-dependent methyltransferase
MYVPGLGRPDRPWDHSGREASTVGPEEERLAGAGHLLGGGHRYTDQELAGLPFIDKKHPHAADWRHRRASCRRLIAYLTEKKKAAGILEVGCGNGWLSHQLSMVPGSRIVGLDPNLIELKQAARVFHGKPNLKFIYGDFYSTVLQDLSFDIIVFAAAVQHFPSLSGLIKEALPYLRPRGEVHILDSCLYHPDLADFHYEYLYDPRSRWNPRSLWNSLSGKQGALPWVCITDPTP